MTERVLFVERDYVIVLKKDGTKDLWRLMFLIYGFGEGIEVWLRPDEVKELIEALKEVSGL